jgi:hypothetical protein
VTTARRTPVNARTFESFTKIGAIEQRMREIKVQLSCERVLFVDLGKNVLAYWLAAERCGIRVVAIADSKLAPTRRKYRGINIVDDETARGMTFDVAIVSNLSPVHAKRRQEQWKLLTNRPVIDLLENADHESTRIHTNLHE